MVSLNRSRERPFEAAVAYVAAPLVEPFTKGVVRRQMAIQDALLFMCRHGLFFGLELAAKHPEFSGAMLLRAKRDNTGTFDQGELDKLMAMVLREIPYDYLVT